MTDETSKSGGPSLPMAADGAVPKTIQDAPSLEIEVDEPIEEIREPPVMKTRIREVVELERARVARRMGETERWDVLENKKNRGYVKFRDTPENRRFFQDFLRIDINFDTYYPAEDIIGGRGEEPYLIHAKGLYREQTICGRRLRRPLRFSHLWFSDYKTAKELGL